MKRKSAALSLKQYVLDIYTARFFCWSLVAADTRARWGGTRLGILWPLIQPLGLTALLSFVLGQIFGQDIRSYAPYVFTGLVTWDFITSSISAGSLSFLQADAYIKQTRRPLAMYSLRTVLASAITFTLALCAAAAWSAIALNQNVGPAYFFLLVVPFLLVGIFWPFATILALAGARYRDLSHSTGLVLQAIWFASPVYFLEEVFLGAGLGYLVYWNPVYHILELVRAPLLRGEAPNVATGFFLLSIMIFGYLSAWIALKKSEQTTVFYL